MDSALACLVLVCLGGFCWGTQASAWPASTVQVRLGENATLPCPLLDDSSAAHSASSRLSWYRKAAGQQPHLLLSFRPSDGSSLKYGSGVRADKVSAAADGSLLLHSSELSDAAIYYCGVSQGQEYARRWPRE